MSHILITPMQETRRRPDGERWCFVCRSGKPFDYVVESPIIYPDRPLEEQAGSYYGPTPSIRCSCCGKPDADLFPGREREWQDE